MQSVWVSEIFTEISGKAFARRIGQHARHGVLGVEMPGVDEIQPEVVRIPELVIAHVCRDERIAPGLQRLVHPVGAAPAAHGNAADGLAAVHIAKAGAAEGPA